MSEQREMVGKLVGRGLSERRACRALVVSRGSLRYEPREEDPVNGIIRQELVSLALRHNRWGSRRMTCVIRREGRLVNHKRVERLYQQLGLPLPRRRPKKKRTGPPAERPVTATKPNEVWSMDFVHDQTRHGEKLKLLTVLDEGCHLSLEIRAEKKMASFDVLETLDELFHEHGVPSYIRTDNGPEFISKKLQDWLKAQGVQPLTTQPGSPWENGFVESFNGKLRDECLNEEIFLSRAECQVLCDWYRRHYNWERPHQSLGGKTPMEFLATYRNQKAPEGAEGTRPN